MEEITDVDYKIATLILQDIIKDCQIIKQIFI